MVIKYIRSYIGRFIFASSQLGRKISNYQ